MELHSIRAALEALVEQSKILVLDEIGSTMDEVRKFDASSGRPGFKGIVVSLSQTLGRGRQGRNWVSKKGYGVYLSTIFKSEIKDQSLLGILPLLVGLKLKEKLAVSSPDIKVKWPNDIVVETEGSVRKLAGLLLEATHESYYSVITIGVGVNLKKNEVQNAISLEEVDMTPWNLADVAYLILDSILQAFDTIESIQIDKFVAQYNSNMAFLNQEISLFQGKRSSITGINKGIDRDGSLLLETAQGISNVYSGDVHQGLTNHE